jgi:hypothetical protein
MKRERWATGGFEMQPLEPRQLMSAALPVVSIVADQSTVPEAMTDPSDSKTVTSEAFYTISRSGPTTHSVEVRYHLDPSSTAVEGKNFAPLDDVITIPAHASSTQVELRTRDDKLFNVTLSARLKLAPGGYVREAGHESAAIGILNYDIGRMDATAPINMSAGGPPGELTITLHASRTSDAPIPFAGDVAITLQASWTERTDPFSLPTTVILPAGQTSVQVPLVLVDPSALDVLEGVNIDIETPGCGAMVYIAIHGPTTG